MATCTESYEIEFPKQSGAEEVANTVTHGLGMVLSALGTVALLLLAIYHHATLGQLLATLVYGLSLTAMYVASTFSHAFQHPGRKQFFRVLDQAVIYCLIAGTYTPFILAYMPPQRKWAVFAFVWTLATVGFLSKAFLKHRVEAVVIANYILLGWVPAMAMVSLMPLDCMVWMACGGVLYTVGTLFLTFDQHVPFFHATWHLCVLAASAFHFFAVVHYTLL
jgi:hemolysin III